MAKAASRGANRSDSEVAKEEPDAARTIAALTPDELAAALAKAREATGPKAGWLDTIERLSVTRLIGWSIAIASSILLLLTAVQLLFDLNDRTQDRIWAALDRLHTRAAANTGKADALQYLWEKRHPFENFDLSCKRIGDWDEAAQECHIPVIFEGLKLSAAPEITWSDWLFQKMGMQPFPTAASLNSGLNDLTFQDAVFASADWEEATVNAVFVNAYFTRGRIIDSTISHDFSGATFNSMDLTGTRIQGSLTGLRLHQVNLSNVIFDLGFEDVLWDSGTGMVAWSDALPRIESSSGGDDPVSRDSLADFPFLPADFLRKIRLCAPPVMDGQVVPIADRPKLIYLTDCQRVGVEAAITNSKSALGEAAQD